MRLTAGTLGNVKTFGGNTPPTDSAFQQVLNAEWQVFKTVGQDGSLYNSFRFKVNFANGFSVNEFVRVPLNDKGEVLPGLTESQVSGNLAGIKTILASQGYTEEQLNGDVDLQTWICNPKKPGHVKVTPGRAATDRELAAKKAGGQLPKDCYASIEWMAPEVWAYGKKVEGESAQTAEKAPADQPRRTSRSLPQPK